ncbi:MAG TPA: DedA family protein [Spirochaetota bacterium]|nr:DedA family protein [Spirochaetota bacterium]HOK92882.1 DedA family protein [Spirochaetota bacterium]HON16354.1 DedA family protein [Spirochaetota bacterium]HPD79157.1 DedA family protein [Spirochaetota bacterium]HPP94980.1 DedA family protein [Spirochaetota bacterium]
MEDSYSVDFIKYLINLYMENINYPAVLFLMTLESTFIPVPSELVVPPAAWKAAQGDLNIFLVVLFSTIGCVLGALINYFLAKTLGRKIIYSLVDTRIAHMMFINRHSMEKSEKFFIKYGKSSTFIGRLVPGVRHLISIPAGISLMNLRDFIFYTFIGSAIWNGILAALGYFLYTQQELLKQYYRDITIAVLILFVVFLIYLVTKIFNNKNNSPEDEGAL